MSNRRDWRYMYDYVGLSGGNTHTFDWFDDCHSVQGNLAGSASKLFNYLEEVLKLC